MVEKTSKVCYNKTMPIPPRNLAINKMVADLISEVDYDLYKSFFVKECEEDPDEAKETRKRLRAIVEQHLPLIEQASVEPLSNLPGPPPGRTVIEDFDGC